MAINRSCGPLTSAKPQDFRYNSRNVNLLLYLSIAFNGWMLLDALRRRAPLLWFIVLLTPIGGLIYFVSVKLRDFGVRPSLQPAAETIPPPDLVALRQAAKDSPSFKNRTALAWALLETGDAAGAHALFEKALQSHPNDPEAMLGCGAAFMAERRPEAAVEPLSRILERNFRYRDFQAARLLTRALLEDGQGEAAIALAQRIADHSRRYLHRLELAQLHYRLGDAEAARLTAVALLSEWDREPGQRRERCAHIAAQAQHLLRELDRKSQPSAAL